MNSILIVYIVMLIGYFLLKYTDTYQVETVLGRRAYRVRPFYAVLFVLPLIILAWQRDQYFGDTNQYVRMFETVPAGFQELLRYLDQVPKDPGYTVFVWLVKSLGFSYRDLFLLTAIIQIIPLIYVYRKYSTNYYLSILLFLISTDYFSWMNNGIRQFIAVSIIFAATPWILEKKYIRTILVILFASSFHQSALLMIPVIFIVQGDALNPKMLIVFILFILSITFVSAFTDLLDSSLQNTQYSNVVTDYTVGDFSSDDGTNPLRVLVYSIPLLLFLLFRIRKYQKLPTVINLSVNMSLFTVGTYLVSMVTSGIFLGRIPIYFSLYNYILLPWVIKKLFPKTQQRLINALIIGLYLVFSYVQFGLSWM